MPPMMIQQVCCLFSCAVCSDVSQAKVLMLPSEMTCTIFTACLPETRTLCATSAPILLCHVCHEWRVLALNLQSLWDSVQFVDLSSRTGLMEYSARAGSRPLTHVYDICSPYHARHIGRACRAFSKQWKALELAIPLDGFKQITRSGVTTFPTLRCISIRPARGFGRPEPLEFKLPASPLLRYARLDYNPRITMTLPWAQLTVLIITSRIPFALRTLEKCTNLVHFTFRLKLGWFTPDPVPSPIIHEKLRQLALDDYPFLLLSMTLPKLEDLSFSLALEDHVDFQGSY